MKKSILFSAVLLALAAVFSLGLAAEAGNISVVNATGFDLYEIYVSDSGTNDWEDDMLGSEVLSSGQTLQISVNGSYQSFDLMAVDNEGTSVRWMGLPGSASTVKIYANGTAEY